MTVGVILHKSTAELYWLTVYSEDILKWTLCICENMEYVQDRPAPGEEAVVTARPLPRTPEPERRLIPRIRSHRRNKTLPNISLPTNVVHTVHVVFNPVTGDLEGLPDSMKALLDASKITKEEKEQNPEAVYQALRYLQDPKNHGKVDKFITQNGRFFFVSFGAGVLLGEIFLVGEYLSVCGRSF
ncbi:serine/threonine-protein kinase pak-1-like [Penaeus japonicus]|uniref:serine/threonine-protein kinase pak-1-like n=1 Tax=Penaeus japonicus TaxID=27405 RepID=UPI001C7143AF|nr:serine/threonine-protein kinase pak-1-like [Penaeus japonicus]